jgi:hypothetical protein
MMARLRYTPYERRSLNNLSDAISAGLSGSTAYDIFSGIQGGALDRLAAARARQQSLRQMLPQMSEFALQAAQAGLPASFTQSAYGGFRSPMVQGALQSLLATLYPPEAQPMTGQGSPGFSASDLLSPAGEQQFQLSYAPTSPYGQTAGPALEASDLQQIDDMIRQANPPRAKPGDGTHDRTLQAVVSRLRLLDYPETEIQEAITYFNQAWVNAGGYPAGR